MVSSSIRPTGNCCIALMNHKVLCKKQIMKKKYFMNIKYSELEMWANAQRDGRPVEHRWRPLLNAAKFG